MGAEFPQSWHAASALPRDLSIRTDKMVSMHCATGREREGEGEGEGENV